MDPVTMAIIGAGAGAMMSPDDPLKGAVLGGIGGGLGGAGLGAMGGAGAAGAGAASGVPLMSAAGPLSGMPTAASTMAGLGMSAPTAMGSGAIPMMSAANAAPVVEAGFAADAASKAAAAVSPWDKLSAFANSPQGMNMGMSMMNQNQQRPMGPPPAAPMMRPQMPFGPIVPPMQRDPEEMRRLAGRSNYAGYLG